MPREADRIRDAFISATATDARPYREGVGEALESLKVAVFLQEYWALPLQDVVTLCLNRIADSDAYIGIFGFRYGWVPDGETRSITECEYDKALDLWGQRTVPPIFLFLPEPGKEAAGLLEAAAAAVLAKDYPDDPVRQAESRRLQKVFCDRMRSAGRFVNTFATLPALRERALAAVAIWNEEILRSSLSRQRTSAIQAIPASELGAIGREADDVDAVDETYGAAVDANAVGVCLVLHGAEDAGQFHFLAYVEQRNPWEISGAARNITPPHDQFDILTLVATALQATAPDLNPPAVTVDVLATALLERSRHQSIVMFLTVDRLSGGLDAFRTGFWMPLVAAARTAAPTVGRTKPFVVVVTMTHEVPTPLAPGLAAAPPAKGPFDATQVMVTPALGALDDDDVVRWLRDHGMKRADAQALAARVIGDGRPRGVFDRLNTANFWARI